MGCGEGQLTITDGLDTIVINGDNDGEGVDLSAFHDTGYLDCAQILLQR